jgi:hypothetical protein
LRVVQDGRGVHIQSVREPAIRANSYVVANARICCAA